MIISENDRKKKRELIGENAIKIALAEITKMLSSIDIQVISNINLDAAKNLGLMSIKKY